MAGGGLLSREGAGSRALAGWGSSQAVAGGTEAPGPLGSTAAQPSGAPEWPTWCPARAPRGWGRGWRQPSAAGTQPPGEAPLGLGSRGPAAAGGPLGGRSGTGAGQGAPRAGRAAPIHGCRCRSSPCGSQRPVREKQKGGGDTDTGGHTPLPGLQPGTSSGAPTRSSQARTGCHPLSRGLTPLPRQEPWSCSRKGPK